MIGIMIGIMKKGLLILGALAAGAALFLPFAASAQDEALKPRVAFVPLVVEGEDIRLQMAGERVSDEIELKLNLMTAFSVSTVDSLEPYRDIEALESFARERRIDNVLFGRIGEAGSDRITLQISVYDRDKGRVIRSVKRESASILELFGAADGLLDLLVQEFSGVHVGFGMLELVPTGEEGDYALYLDGERIGTNLTRVGKVLNGNRLVEIVQSRMFGREVIYSGSVVVYEDEIATVSFQIPCLLGKEENVLHRHERKIEELKGDPSRREAVLEGYKSLIALLSNVSYCRRLEARREDYRQQDVEYRLAVNYRDIEDNFYRPEPWLFDDLERISPQVDSYRESDKVRTLIWRNATYLFSTLRLNAGYAFSYGRWEEGAGYYEQMERIVTGVPLDDRDWFFQEKEFVDKRWEAYRKKIGRNEVTAEIRMGMKMASRFKDLVSDGEEVFTEYNVVDPGEVIVLTDPWGMQLSMNDRGKGQSPVRIRNVKESQVLVRVDDPWYLGEEVTVDLSKERAIVFIRSEKVQEIQTKPVEQLGRGRYRIEWEELEQARAYRVQVDTSDGDFSQPLIDVAEIRDNRITLSEDLEPGTYYRFRVQGINRNGVTTGWSYGGPFAVDGEGMDEG
jgi:hypothetical protein